MTTFKGYSKSSGYKAAKSDIEGAKERFYKSGPHKNAMEVIKSKEWNDVHKAIRASKRVVASKMSKASEKSIRRKMEARIDKNEG